MPRIELLMCPPVHVKAHPIKREYNRYQREENQPSIAGAMGEWAELLRKVNRAGAKVHIIGPREGLGDMQFAANAMWGRGGDHVFVMSNHAPEHRRPERQHYASWLVDNGYSVLFLNPKDEEGEIFEDLFFAGQGMVVSTPNQYFIGHNPRTTLLAIDRIQKELHLSKEVVPLKLPDDGSFYDLDVVMHYSREADEILFYPGAFDKEGLWALEHARVSRITTVSRISSVMQYIEEEDSYNFTLNAPYIENVEIFPRRGPVSSLPKEIRELEKHGKHKNIEIATIHLPQHGKLGGGARCLIGFLT